MRIQANDDVYETTRHRMAVAEENNKNKCTRVIKPNGPDIGRKVKVKGTGRTIPPPSSSYPRHRDYMSIPTSGSSQFRSSTSRPPTSSSSSNSNHSATARSPQEKKIISDLMRRPLKERLIHVLALRPYKKPELYDRINKEGLREKEKPIMSTILRQVAYIRDNTYHLNRHIWNDVQEDWPFYNEQERAMLKRRKPQNLTPPGSSDGSSGSGQSPNSIHAGSPPAITAPPPSLLNKRPGYYQGSDGLPTKKPRVSHYKRPEPIPFIAASDKMSDNSNSYSNNKSPSGVSATVGGHRVVDHIVERSTGGNSACGGNNNSGGADYNNSDSGDIISNWGSRQQTQRERSNRADYRVERTANSDVRDAGSGGPAVSANVTSTVISNRPSCLSLTSSPSANERNNHHQSGHGRDSSNTTTSGSARSTGSAERRDRNDRNRGVREDRNREKESRNRSSVPSSASSYNDSSNNAAAYADNINDNDIAIPFCDLGRTEEYPDYLTYYTTVSSAEQRARYREDFEALYPEYRQLYSSMDNRSRLFKEMYDVYDECKKSGDAAKTEELQHQIQNAYVYYKKDKDRLNEKNRFDYLHGKLSHIKKLIMQYDGTFLPEFPAIMGNNATQTDLPIADASTNVNIGDFDSRHY
ncbi:RNA polymerase II elongation factor Ell isoform X2 [Pseudomyrmex gracilis]|nr:RNA polymerase II elongation factor Ell isoform X2 [Pseudomyrmex gracilis]